MTNSTFTETHNNTAAEVKKTTERSGPKPVGAAKLTIEIMRTLARQNGAMGVTPLAAKLDRYPGTVYGVLKTLQSEGVVEFNPATKCYRLCIGGLLEMNINWRPQDLPNQISTELEDTAEDFGICIFLSQRVRKDAIVIVSSAAPDRPLALQAKIGSRFHVPMGAAGRLIAGIESADEKELRKAYRKTKWLREKAPYEDWAAQVAEDIERGYAIETDTAPEGYISLCVPVVDPHNKVAFAINAIGPAEDFSGDQQSNIVAALKNMARTR
ncbi:MAG: helix-turn-helix domain-containing protein [Alteromonadaceae bacterium]|nr:helix-turn-helix domain-containing protein [Alteromonadaceae bacterium]